MDRITTSLLATFSKEFGIDGEAEDRRFEQFATYLTVHRHYNDAAFVPDDLTMGSASGIDAIAVIVNNNLVSDVDTITELLVMNGFIDASFIFIQADRGGFSAAKAGQFGFAVKDFFGDGKLQRNDEVTQAVSLMNAVFEHAGKFKNGNPTCHLYYVSSGKYSGEADLKTRADAEVADLVATGNFRQVEFHYVGADMIQKLYNQAKNAIQREFVFVQRTVLEGIEQVKEAHIGYMTAKDFLALVCDEDGAIVKSLFYENVRDWYGYNEINSEMQATLQSQNKDRFVLMNNGITIIAKSLATTGNRFTMGDFQVVNGCQTSHVLRDNIGLLTDDVRIPVRIICTPDEAVMESIITATNRQTAVSQDQFFALNPFAKKLEAFFRSFEGDKQLYYERRAHQYDSQDVPRGRIIGHQNLVRAVGSMFLGEPHRTTRNYRGLAEQIGKNFFCASDKSEPYYVSAYALYSLEVLFKTRLLPAVYKPGRYHILLAARLLMDKEKLPSMGSNEMVRRAEAMIQALWKDADSFLISAAAIVDEVAARNWARDHIRTQPITDAIYTKFGRKRGIA